MTRGAAAGRRGAGRRPSGLRPRYEAIYASLRTRICLLDYPPGMRLREDDLAAEFETSRTPVRRVLARLEDEGLLRSVHGVGTIVTDIDIDELRQVYQLRVELSELIGKLAPVSPDEATIAAFRDVHERCERLIAAPDVREFARINMDFFHLLMRLTSNDPLRDISERLYYQTTRIWLRTASRLSQYEELLNAEIAIFRREVADIVAAVATGDLEIVGHIRRSHVAMSFARLHVHAHPETQSS